MPLIRVRQVGRDQLAVVALRESRDSLVILAHRVPREFLERL